MKKIVLTYGLISGALAAVFLTFMALSVHNSNMDMSGSEIYGYSGMLLSMLLTYFGVRRYRDQVAGGSIPFAKAFQVGILITLISCLCYVAAWLILYYNFMPDFMDRYIEQVLAEMKSSGATEAAIQKKTADMDKYKSIYSTPFGVAAITFMEPFPLGLVVTLITALIVRRKPAQ